MSTKYLSWMMWYHWTLLVLSNHLTLQWYTLLMVHLKHFSNWSLLLTSHFLLKIIIVDIFFVKLLVCILPVWWAGQVKNWYNIFCLTVPFYCQMPMLIIHSLYWAVMYIMCCIDLLFTVHNWCWLFQGVIGYFMVFLQWNMQLQAKICYEITCTCMYTKHHSNVIIIMIVWNKKRLLSLILSWCYVKSYWK